MLQATAEVMHFAAPAVQDAAFPWRWVLALRCPDEPQNGAFQGPASPFALIGHLTRFSATPILSVHTHAGLQFVREPLGSWIWLDARL